MGKFSKMWGSGIGTSAANLVLGFASYMSGMEINSKDALITWLVTTIGAMVVTYFVPKNTESHAVPRYAAPRHDAPRPFEYPEEK